MAEQLTEEYSFDSPKYWKVELDSATKRQKDFWQVGGKIDARFKDERKTDGDAKDRNSGNQFRLNLFHANVETQMAMLYGRVPKTDVCRRHADPNDDVARVGAEILQRMLNNQVQAPGSADPDILRCCLQDRLLPGLGLARVRYDFEKVTSQEIISVRNEDGSVGTETIDVDQLVDEFAPIEYVHWRDVRWGYARTWAQVPWVSFDSYLDKKEFTKRFGEEWAERVSFNIKMVGTKEDNTAQDESKADPWMKAKVTEIWCRKTKKVYWYCDECNENLLDIKDDPLGLRGFYPCPEPMAANCTTSLYIPTADFRIAQDLYNYIDTLQTRISVITQAVKVVGLYDSSNAEIKRMFEEGTDNDLIPVSNWAMFAEKQGLKGQIDWLPLKDIVEALAKLQELRNEAIELLYQVTGMSDILRGYSEQYSGVGQEQLKAKFASVRMQRTEEEFAKFASELMRLRAEVIARHFEVETIYAQSGAKYLMEDFELIEAGLQLLKSREENWMWQIEIKSENMAMLDYAQIKAERTEFLSAMGTFLNSAESVGASSPDMIPFLLEMMRWGLAGFKGSQQIEGVLDKAIRAAVEKLKQPQQEQPNPKVQEIQAKAQAEAQKQAQKHQDEMVKLATTHAQKMKEMMTDQYGDVQFEQIQAYLNNFETQMKHLADMKLEKLRQAGRPNASNNNR